jgi:hypothetical protein
VAALTGDPTLWNAQHTAHAWTTSAMGMARLTQLCYLLPAAGPLLLGAAALAFPSGRRALAGLRPLAVFTAITLAAWVILLWGGVTVPAIIHQGSYAAFVLFVGLCAAAATALPRPLAGVILAADAAWFALCWVPGLGFIPGSPNPAAPPRLDVSMLIVCLAALALLVVTCDAVYRPRRARPGR